MGKAKRGRPRKEGARYRCGRLKLVHDKGNARRQEQEARFAAFQGGKAGPWVSESAIGRAWAVGLLDGYRADAAAIRDAGLRYGELRRAYGFNTPGGAVSNYGGEDRRGRRDCGEDRPGHLYRKLDQMVLDAGWASYDAVQALCCDYSERPWENPPWLDRLINRELVKQRRPISGYLPRLDGGDERLMKLAVEGLLTMVAGRARKVA